MESELFWDNSYQALLVWWRWPQSGIIWCITFVSERFCWGQNGFLLYVPVLDDNQITPLLLPAFRSPESPLQNAVRDNAGSRESFISFAVTQFLMVLRSKYSKQENMLHNFYCLLKCLWNFCLMMSLQSLPPNSFHSVLKRNDHYQLILQDQQSAVRSE